MHRLLFVLLAGCVACLSARAQSTASADLERLARDPVWLRLLHAGPDGRSEVNSPDFFLAPSGASDPLAELRATLAQAGTPLPADAHQHPRCRFPARYWWLARQGVLPAAEPIPPGCTRLARWAQLDRLQSVSLLLVSGYFGNPASSFGHALLKFNTGDADARLFDLSFNFGALVPEGEPMLRYVWRGLTGGYESGFTDRYFYTHDLVYARTEFRDVWDYELALTPEQRTLLVLHLWEVAGRKFTYYFLTKNCAYRLAELVELATGHRLTDRAALWYVPVELFHRLHEIDAPQPGRLIRSIRFLPSSQRQLVQQFRQLDAREADAANRVIRGDDAVDGAWRAAFAPERQIDVTDALLAYYEYRLAAEEPAPSPALQARKAAALRQRLQLPAREQPDAEPSPLRSPAQGGAPMMLGAGLARDGGAGGYLRLRWAPYYWDLVGDNGLSSGGGAGELVVLDTAVGVDRSRVFVERIDVIRARKLDTGQVNIAGEQSWSWQTQIGWSRVWRSHDDGAPARGQPLAVARMGVGRAWSLHEDLLATVMLDGLVQSRFSLLAAEPQVAVIAGGRGPWRAVLRMGRRYEFTAGNSFPASTAEARWQLSQHRALRLDASREAAGWRLGFSYQSFW